MVKNTGKGGGGTPAKAGGPYKWVNKDLPIMIDDSTYQQWIKSDIEFKKMYQRADSLQLKKKKPVIF